MKKERHFIQWKNDLQDCSPLADWSLFLRYKKYKTTRIWREIKANLWAKISKWNNDRGEGVDWVKFKSASTLEILLLLKIRSIWGLLVGGSYNINVLITAELFVS